MLHANRENNLFLHFFGPIDREVTMLDLPFKNLESLSIKTSAGEVIHIQVLDTSQDSVMLAINAPSSCTIHREAPFSEVKDYH